MEHPVARTLTRLLCVLALAPPVAHARTVEPAADGWILERWTREDGLPIDHIRDMAVDPAGLLWLATFDGLVRFDGLGFETFRTSHPEGPPSNRLITLAVNPGDGALWVRTDDFVLQRRSAAGLQTFAQEHFDWFTPGDRTLWVSGVRGVYRLEETPRLALPLDG
ncbi:MAG: hypothetical protein KC420_18515, partial [Myxococcales bacterium]|nr:hypothetical protein [Myxococcales bacterium]